MEDKKYSLKSIEDLEENRYLLVNLVAQRARQINEGVETYIEKADDKTPIEIALEEILAGKITHEPITPKTERNDFYDDEFFSIDEMLEPDELLDSEDYTGLVLEGLDIDHTTYEEEEEKEEEPHHTEEILPEEIEEKDVEIEE